MAILEHLALFALVCFLSTIVVAAYHEDDAPAMLRSALRRTATLGTGCLVLTGILFVVTTLGYVVAWLRLAQPGRSPGGDELGPVLRFVNDHGDRLMVWEVVALAILAVLAMGMDRWRAASQSEGGAEPTQDH